MSKEIVNRWFEASAVLSSAVKRERNNYADGSIDWERLDQTILGASVLIGCAILEANGIYKKYNEDTFVLFEIRNAITHWDFDFSGLDNEDAFDTCFNYLLDEKYKKFNDVTNKPFDFPDNSQTVKLNQEMYHFIKMIIIDAFKL